MLEKLWLSNFLVYLHAEVMPKSAANKVMQKPCKSHAKASQPKLVNLNHSTQQHTLSSTNVWLTFSSQPWPPLKNL
jgi:hypothetical protein